MNTEDLDNIEKLYRTREWSLRALAGFYDVTHETIRQILIRREVPLNPPHKFLNSP